MHYPSAKVAFREEEATEVHGHITSLAVARTHRKLGLATRLMTAAREPPCSRCFRCCYTGHSYFKSLSGGSMARQECSSLKPVSRHGAAPAREAPAVKCAPTRADQAMADVFDAEYVSLHVRVTNKGAFHLYTRTLGYECAPCSTLPVLCSCLVRRSNPCIALMTCGRCCIPSPTAPRPCRARSGHTSTDTFAVVHARSIHDREAKYYADGEDAYDMRKRLKPAKAKAEDGKAAARKAKA